MEEIVGSRHIPDSDVSQIAQSSHFRQVRKMSVQLKGLSRDEALAEPFVTFRQGRAVDPPLSGKHIIAVVLYSGQSAYIGEIPPEELRRSGTLVLRQGQQGIFAQIREELLAKCEEGYFAE
jgi:hypothetical protein